MWCGRIPAYSGDYRPRQGSLAEALVETFAARSEKLVRGFAIGRTIFGAPARKWFDGEMMMPPHVI